MQAHLTNTEANQSRQILALLSLPNVGKKKVINLMKKIISLPTQAKDLADALIEHYPAESITKNKVEVALENAEHLLEEHRNHDIKVISFTDPEFPDSLRQIDNPPVVLYVKGNYKCLAPERSIAVIGTRTPTKYGSNRAFRLGQVFGERGLVVVSGLAKGCDKEGHQGCLSVNGQTVAVLAHGLGQVYPKEHQKLADQIVDNDGCLVSEHQLGVSPRKNFFVERNRIQSGLSSAVVIVETDIKGGTMHTARFCLQQSRYLACIDHKPENESNKSCGNKKLLREENAIPLRTPEQLESFITLILNQANSSSNLSEKDHSPNSLDIQTIDKTSRDKSDNFDPYSINKTTSEQTLLFSEENLAQKSEPEKSKSNEQLSRKELAERLQVHPSTISKNKNQKDNEGFKVWSSKKDPDNRCWEYNTNLKKYVALN